MTFFDDSIVFVELDVSYERCTPDEQLLWMRASVFSGGFTLDAAAEVCTDARLPRSSMLPLLAGLVDKSVLIRAEEAGTTRLRMPGANRRYGRRLLAHSGDRPRMRGRHLGYFLALVERTEKLWIGPDQLDLADRVRREHDNLCTALEFGLSDAGDVLPGARLATRLHFYWFKCGFLSEGRRWLDRVLELDGLPVGIYHTALCANSCAATVLGEVGTGQRMAIEAVAIARREGDSYMLAEALLGQASSAFVQGDYARADALYEQSIECYATTGVVNGRAAVALAGRAMVAAFMGNFVMAVPHAQRAIEIATQHGEQWFTSYAYYALAVTEWRMGRPEVAIRNVENSIRIRIQFHDVMGLSILVELLAWIAASRGSGERAAELLGIASSLARRAGGSLMFTTANWSVPHREAEDMARTVLGAEQYEAIHVRGARIGDDPDSAVDHVLRDLHAVAGQARHTPAILTSREFEVAALAATGASNREIAARLVISVRTAESHVNNILKKLGFTSRSLIVAWIADQSADSRSGAVQGADPRSARV